MAEPGVRRAREEPDVPADVGPTVLSARVDRLLDTSLVLLASWTLVYHLSLLLDLTSDVALAVEAGLLVVLLVAASRRAHPMEPSPTLEMASPSETGLGPRRSFLAVRVTVVAGLVAALAMALGAPWLLVWPCWLLAAGAGLVAGVTSPTDRDPPGAGSPPGPHVTWPDRAEGTVVLALTAGLAVLSTLVLRPNPDDLYYVNLSQWVAEHGTFPVRDTIFGDLVFPMSNWPPLASYDGLTGAVAHLLGVRAGDVVYVVVPPVATALAVLASWRLLRAWRVRPVVVALGFAMLFLLVDGTSSYGPPGNLFLTRLWQGKVILLCVVVPLLLVHALAYVRRPSRGRAGWLATGGVAAVACSTTAIFLVPVVALAGMAPLVLTRGRRDVRAAVVGFAALAAYPLVGGVATLALGGRSADDFGERRGYRFDPSWFGHAVFLTDLLAFVGVAAVLVGSLLLPLRAARTTTALLVLAAGITFVPGFTRVSYDVVGLGPTLWRVTWGCTVAALVGTLAAWLWSRAPSRRTAVAGAVVAALALVAFGAPILRSDTSAHWAVPPHWQRGSDSRALTAWILRHTRSGDVVLAPDDLAITVAVTTTDVKTVAPRDYYLSYLRDDPSFDYDDRLTLVEFANDEPGRREDIVGSLQALDVRIACVYRSDARGAALLRAAGYRRGTATPGFRCLRALNPT
jgi:hypothetical protein